MSDYHSAAVLAQVPGKSAHVNHLEAHGLEVATFAQYVTGIKQEIPSSRMDRLSDEVRTTAMRVVERARPRLAASFINAANDDLETPAESSITNLACG